MLDDKNIDYSNDMQHFLEQLGVFRKDRNDGNRIKLTKGGLLFFGKLSSIKDLIPHFQLDYFEIDSNSENRWEDRVSSGDMEYLDLNIFDFYLIVRNKLDRSTKDKFMLDSEQNKRLTYKADLNESIREALVNSLMHAHYDINSPVLIKSYNSYLEFKNPGIMKITPTEFFNGGISKQVNEIISTLFRRVGFSERAGTGGKKISDVSTKLKLRNPEILPLNDSCTTLRIWKKDLLSTLNLQGNDLVIMAYMVKNIVATRKQISEELELSEYYTRNSLNKLIELEYLKVQGKGKSTKYILSINNNVGREGVLRHLIRNLDTI